MRVPSGVEYLQAYPSRLGGGIGTAAAAAVVTPPPDPEYVGMRTEWTASVTTLCRSRSSSVVSFPAKGPTQPRRFGEMPPVTFFFAVGAIYI